MKSLINKLIKKSHFVVLAIGIYGVYTKYEEHNLKINEITAQYPAIDAEIKAGEKNIAEIQENMGKINEFKVRVEEVAKNIEAVQKQLPAEIGDAQISGYLNQEMRVLNIKDTNLTPGAEVTGTYFVSKDYVLKAKGTFLQFLILLERVGNADRIYNIKSLKLVTATDTQKGRFQILEGEAIIQAFRFNPDFKIDRGFEKVENDVSVKQ